MSQPRRPVYGRVYELITGDPWDGAHPYVGLVRAPRTITARVNEHRRDVDRYPWKAHILPGRAGWRQLEVVYATADPSADEASLRRAEADWIDRLRTTHNDVRPVRPPVNQVQPAPRAARPAAKVRRRARRRVPVRPIAALALMALSTWLAAWFVLAMRLPWPAAPWVASPLLGGAGGFLAFIRIHAMGRRAKLWR